MSLDLQLTTKNARGELAALDASLSALKSKLEAFGNTKGFEKPLDKIASFKGVEQSAIASLNALSTAMQHASAASSSIGNISKGLNALARVRVDAIANNVERVSKALSGLRVPPSLDRFATTLARINSSAAGAAASVRQLGGAMGSVRVPQGLTALSNSLARVRGSAGEAASGFQVLNGASNTLRNTLAGFGVALGAFGFAQFTTAAYDAVRAVDQFKSSISATHGSMAAADKEWTYAQSVADRYAVSIESVSKSYSKFSASAKLAGVETQTIHKIFDAMAMTSRVLGMSADQSERAFKALEQMMSKGKVTAEELRQQLGDSGLAGAFNLMAQAVGVSASELDQMMKNGQVLAASALPKFADILVQKYGGGLQTALDSSSAAFTRLGNSAWSMMEAFGRGFFDEVKGSVLSLAEALKDPAFTNAAVNIGKTLGMAFNAVVQVVTLVIQNFDLLKNALMILAAIQVGSIVSGWVTSLAAAGQVASLTAANVGALIVTFGRMSFVSNLLVGIRAAFAAVAVSSGALAFALGPIGLAIAALAFAVPTVIALYYNWADVSTYLSGVTAQVSDGISWLANSLSSLIPLPPEVSSGLMTIAKAIWNTLASFMPFAKAIDMIVAAWNYFFPAATKAASATNTAATAAGNATGALNNAAGGANNFAGSLGRSASAANSAAAAYNNAAAAASRYNAAAAGGGGGKSVNHVSVVSSQDDIDSYRRGGNGVSVVSSQEEMDAYGYKYGGIAGKATSMRYRLPTSAWANAPSFAGGGLSDGGIPAVLHPNEAVVPLTGGGQIPVANMSTGQGSLLLLKPLNLLVDYQKQTKTEVSRVWEATTNQTVLMKNALDRIETVLVHIDNSRFTDLINALNTGLSNIRGAVGSGSYSYSSGGVPQGRTAAGNSAALVDEYFRYLDVAAATGNYPGIGMAAGGGGQLVMVDGKVMAANSPMYQQALAEKVRQEVERTKAYINAGYYTDADIEKQLKKWRADSQRGFATGSPNAWKDVTGGFQATLHPDEAVIPLPDGRAVPVDMPSSFMSRVQALISEGDKRVASTIERTKNGRTSMPNVNNVSVTFNVNAKDAASFNASKDQIMRDLQKNLDRAMRRVGRATDVDDPTKRA